MVVVWKESFVFLFLHSPPPHFLRVTKTHATNRTSFVDQSTTPGYPTKFHKQMKVQIIASPSVAVLYETRTNLFAICNLHKILDSYQTFCTNLLFRDSSNFLLPALTFLSKWLGKINPIIQPPQKEKKNKLLFNDGDWDWQIYSYEPM